MNAPYELRCVRSSDPETQAALEKTTREVVETNGVLCLSRTWKSILMWGAKFRFSKKPIDDALKDYAEEVAIVKVAASPTNFEITIGTW
jgi:hypothetical protein